MKKIRAATDTLLELAAIYTVLLVASAFVFRAAEGTTLIDSLYWAGTTATSTGYGDISPKTAAGKLLALLLMHLSILVVAPLIVVRLMQRLNEDRDAFTHDEQVRILEGIARIETALAAREAQDRPDTRPRGF